MNLILKNKGVILFYVALIVCSQIYVWRIDRLEKQVDHYNNNVIITVK